MFENITCHKQKKIFWKDVLFSEAYISLRTKWKVQEENFPVNEKTHSNILENAFCTSYKR